MSQKGRRFGFLGNIRGFCGSSNPEGGGSIPTDFSRGRGASLFTGFPKVGKIHNRKHLNKSAGMFEGVVVAR